MKRHCIKLNYKYVYDVVEKRKKFEVRYNDRDYCVGDEIVFIVVDDKGDIVKHFIEQKVYKIIYIFDDLIGLKENYIIFEIEELT